MDTSKRQTIKFPKGKAYGKVISEIDEWGVPYYDLKNSKWFDAFWKKNRKTLVEQAKYYTDNNINTRNVKKLFRQQIAERIATDNFGDAPGKKGIKSAVKANLRTHAWGGQRDTEIENLQRGIKYFGKNDDDKSVSAPWKKLKRIEKKYQGINWDTLTYLGENSYSVELGSGKILTINFDESPKEIRYTIEGEKREYKYKSPLYL